MNDNENKGNTVEDQADLDANNIALDGKSGRNVWGKYFICPVKIGTLELTRARKIVLRVLEQNRKHMAKEAKRCGKIEKKLKMLMGRYQVITSRNYVNSSLIQIFFFRPVQKP